MTSEEDQTVCGQPFLYIRGHVARKYPQTYVVEDRGYLTPCWIWQGYIDDQGYGHTWEGEGAHRHFYEEKHGAIPDGKPLDHLCRVRRCCNPDHVEPVTDAINTQRGLLAKLSPESVEMIRMLYAKGGRSQQSIANEFGITQVNVGSIVRRETWKNIA